MRKEVLIMRGGKREGAGRPKTDNKPRTIRVTDEEYEKVKEFIDQLKNNMKVESIDLHIGEGSLTKLIRLGNESGLSKIMYNTVAKSLEKYAEGMEEYRVKNKIDI